MKSDSQIKPLSELAKAYENKDLKVNPEYQRGTKWQRAQRQSLIDSILRGFSIPLFYVHLEEHPDTFTGKNRTNAWIVDGQQRLSANPEVDFLNEASGKSYAHKKIPGTELYLCTHSDTPQKVRKLRELVATLFPNSLGAIQINRV